MELAAAVLEEKGYHRYEVASYAKPGFESKHNSVYWSGKPYLGLGTSAASMQNLADRSRKRWQDGEETELLTAEEAIAEDLFLAMRTSQGVSEEQLTQASGLLPQVNEVFEELQQLGLVEHCDQCYKPTKKGWLLGNELYSRIWELV